MDPEYLIRLVEKHLCLYDRYHKYYSDNSARERAWMEIAKEMGNVTATECKERWTSIRDCYRKALCKRERYRIRGKLPQRPFRYEEELGFLRPHLVWQERNVEGTDNTNVPLFVDNAEFELKLEIPDDFSDNNADDPCSITAETPRPASASSSHTDLTTPPSTTNRTQQRRRARDVPAQNSESAGVGDVINDVMLDRTPATNSSVPSYATQNDAISKFFSSMADTVRSLPPDLQVIAKRRVLEAVSDCEMTAINRQYVSFGGQNNSSYASSFNTGSYNHNSINTIATTTTTNNNNPP